MEVFDNENIRLVALIFSVGIGAPVVFLVIRFLALAAIHDLNAWRNERAIRAMRSYQAKGSDPDER